MKTARSLAALCVAAAVLGGCSTLQKLNPFGHKTLKAPCNAIASAELVATTCELKPFDDTLPTEDELLRLRGPIDPRTGRSGSAVVIAAP